MYAAIILVCSLFPYTEDEEMSQPSQMQVYIKKWRPSTYTIEACDEVILSDATPKHLKQQVNTFVKNM